MSSALRKGRRKRVVTTQSKLLELKNAYTTDCMAIFSVAAIKAFCEVMDIKPITADMTEEQIDEHMKLASEYTDHLFGIIQYLQKDSEALLKYKKQMETDYGLDIKIDYNA